MVRGRERKWVGMGFLLGGIGSEGREGKVSEREEKGLLDKRRFGSRGKVSKYLL